MKKKLLKFVATFLVLTILFEVVIPTLSFAIGSGPSAPEYNSFMQAGQGLSVSPQTGDMSYNIPIVNLPCPEGDYPINLFYNAGITSEQDASWTGLGWNLNVGSISRNVKGIPDDYFNAPYKILDEAKGHANLAEILDGASKASPITNYDLNSPLFVNFDVGFPTNYNITNTSKTQNYNQYGILHSREAGLAAVTGQNGNPNIMFDSYPLFDKYEDITLLKTNPENFNGGTLPSYDEYMVSGQGFSGIMEPLVLDNTSLFRQGKFNLYNNMGADNLNVSMSYNILKLTSPSTAKHQFRFKGEFSNSLVVNPTNYAPINNNSDASIAFGANGLGYTYTVPESNSLNPSTLKFPGANHIDYYLNEEIVSGAETATGF